MKIYMVIADNGQPYEDHNWWNVDAFISEEAAREYVQKLPSIIEKKENRMDELDELCNSRVLTDLEKKERTTLFEQWDRYWHFFDYGYFRIEEYKIRE